MELDQAKAQREHNVQQHSTSQYKAGEYEHEYHLQRRQQSTLHANHHSLAVDVANLQQGNFCTPHAGAVDRHQQRALHEIAGRIDELSDLIQTQHRRQATLSFGIG